MGVLLSVYSDKKFNEDQTLLVEQAVKLIESYGKKEVRCFQNDKVLIAQWDFNAYKQAAWLQNDTQIASLVGHPLISDNRTDDLQCLAESHLLSSNLSESEGAFCFVKYTPHNHHLTIATDPLGLRPFFVMEYKGLKIISSRVSVFKELGLELTANADALTEYATLGYYLLNHTPYLEVTCSYPSEIISLKPDEEQRSHYFDWVELAKQNLTMKQAVSNIDRAFKRCCDKYLSVDQNVISTLSGGLDSRTIATELRRRNANVKAFNFSRQKTQDLACAIAYAEHQSIDLDIIEVSDTQKASVEDRLGKHWQSELKNTPTNIERPQLSWSGNGGSVGIGLIYYSEPLYQAALTGDPEILVDAYLEQQYAYLPESIVEDAQQLQDNLRKNILKSLEPLSDLPLEKAYQLFLFLNDQHHHLSIPFEEITTFKMEFCLPMYSWKVLAAPLGLPVEEVRKHKFYLQWLHHSYPQATEVAWQAYPGHIPCPHPMPAIDQWQMASDKRTAASEVIATWKKAYRFKSHQLLKKSRISMLCILHLLGLKNARPQLNVVNKLIHW
ncbi:asparagine synthase-related protein [Vibrio nigripulchritudo]|uniref:asparagine synthase-related protein n=1 Tax=Vibrio nigripulchritudo TaxID=28173 RepID=UPI00069709B4|nr:asparagine synthase-related protein [Vibrio nigripulchritudo]